MRTHRQPQIHHSDSALPCGCASCRRSNASGIKSTPRPRTIASVVALMVVTMAVGSHGMVPVVAADVPIPAEGRGVSVASDSFADTVGRQFEITRRLETTADAEDAHLFEDGHEGHDHDEVTAAVVEEANEDNDDHENHDHGDDVDSSAEEESHEGHDHGDDVNSAAEEESHEGHDHGDEDPDEEDDHAGHDHRDMESVLSTEENATEKLPWWPVIGASIIVNLAALSGVLIVVMAAVQRGVLEFQGRDSSSVVIGHGKLFDICIPAFAVGALLATAVFLIFPEAVHLIEGRHADEGDSHDGHDHRYLQEDSHEGHEDSSESANAAKFGCAVLAGFLLPLLFSIFFHEPHDFETVTNASADGEDGCEACIGCDVETGVTVTAKTPDSSLSTAQSPPTIVQKVEEESPLEENFEEVKPVETELESVPLIQKTLVNKQLCSAILLGDGFHNFGDGIFIGAAFKSCSTGTAMSIVIATLLHEIAQELADFVVLTRYAGLSISMACLLNFLSGLSVCLGGVVFLAFNPTDEVTGVILAMAGGVYFYIAGCETIPRIENTIKGRIDRFWTLLSIIVGTVPIGLILLNHEHC